MNFNTTIVTIGLVKPILWSFMLKVVKLIFVQGRTKICPTLTELPEIIMCLLHDRWTEGEWKEGTDFYSVHTYGNSKEILDEKYKI